MPRRGQKHSAASRQRISEGVSRGQRAWKGGLRLLPAHIARYAQNGQVVPQLRPSLAAAVSSAANYSDDLGGFEALTQGERIKLEILVRARTILNAMMDRFVKTGDYSALEGASPWLASEREVLAALGLQRRAQEIDAEFSEERLQAAAAAAGRTVDELLGHAPASVNDRSPTGSAGSEEIR